MAHPFRANAAELVEAAFSEGGESATYQRPGQAPVSVRAIPDAADAVALADIFSARVRATRRTIALQRELVPERPRQFDRITVGALAFTLTESAVSEDALGLVWLCPVTEGALLAPRHLDLRLTRPRPAFAASFAREDARFFDLALARPKAQLFAAGEASITADAGLVRPRAVFSATLAVNVADTFTTLRPAAQLVAAGVVAVPASLAAVRAKAQLASVAGLALGSALTVTRGKSQLAAFATLGDVRVVDLAAVRPKAQLVSAVALSIVAAASLTRPKAQLSAATAALLQAATSITRPKPQLAASSGAIIGAATAASRQKAQLSADAVAAIALAGVMTRPKAQLTAATAAAIAAAAGLTRAKPLVIAAGTIGNATRTVDLAVTRAKALLASAATAAVAAAAGLTRPKAQLSAATVAAIAAAADLTRPKLVLAADADVSAPAGLVVESVARGNRASNTTSHVIALPATVNNGDLLVALFSVDENPTITWDNSTAGTWTELFDVNEGANVGVRFNAWFKFCDGTEGGKSLTVTTSNTQQSASQVYRISGAQAVEAATFQEFTQTPDPPNLAPSWGAANTLWLIAAAWDNNTADPITFPANYTANGIFDEANTTNGCSVFSSYRIANVASENPGAFTVTGGANDWVSATIAVRPA